MADLWRAKGDQFFDSNGDPLNGGLFRFYDATTTNARTVYQDSDALVPWTQPITLDSAGRLTASIYIPTGAFKETLANSSDVQVYSEDNIPGAITIPDADYARPSTPVITKASTYSVVAADLGSLFELDATGGDFTITLLSAITAADGAVVYMQAVGTGGKITIATAGAQTINGASSLSLTRQYGAVKLTSDGSNWSAVQTDAPFGTLSKTAAYTVTLADYGKLILADATSAGFTVTLPAAASAGAGFIIEVKKTDSSTNAVTLDGDGAETIDGAATITLANQYASVLLRCDGSNWHGNRQPTATVAQAGTGTDTEAPVTSVGLYPAEVDVASATTCAIGAAASSKVRITGTTTITAFDTVAAGITRTVRFAGALTLTHNATSLILPGGVNITTAAGDSAEALSLGSGNWKVYFYQKATGFPLAGTTDYQVFTSSGTWTKPSNLGSSARVYVEIWGGGGGGGNNSSGGGGGGGCYADGWFLASDLGATETVTIGAAGAVSSAGGTTTFGSWLSAYGGGGGVAATQGGGGGGGGRTSAGSNGSTTNGGDGGTPTMSPGLVAAADPNGGTSGTHRYGGGGGDSDNYGGNAIWGGGGGAGGDTSHGQVGGNSIWGGAGGGDTGGTSLYGGAGGAESTAGTAPGGGGGHGAVGARGECRVTTFP